MLSISKQKGSSLIEVLVAILILAVGLIGFAGLQSQALRVNYETLQRTRASALAEDLFDRMRSNHTQAINTDNYERDFGEDLPTANVDCGTASCTPVEMAKWDLNDWLTSRARAQLGNDIDASVIRNPNGVTSESSLYEVRIRLIEVTESRDNTAVIVGQDDPQWVNYTFTAFL